MSRCMVCRNRLEDGAKHCAVCGFCAGGQRFLSDAHAHTWYQETVLPYRTEWQKSERTGRQIEQLWTSLNESRRLIAALQQTVEQLENKVGQLEGELGQVREAVRTADSSREARQIVDSGRCGDHLQWALESDGMLTVSGEGVMTLAPWLARYSERIQTVVLEEGITSIQSSAFSYCVHLRAITLPQSLLRIGGYAFYGCSDLREIIIPKQVMSIENLAFGLCSSLRTIRFQGKQPYVAEQAFQNVSAWAYYPAWWEYRPSKNLYGANLTWVAE